MGRAETEAREDDQSKKPLQAYGAVTLLVSDMAKYYFKVHAGGCGKISSLSTPSPCGLEGDDFFEVVQGLKTLLRAHRLVYAALPFWLILRSKHQVIIANDFRCSCGEDFRKKMFQIVLVGDEQVTVGAVAAGFVQREQVHRVHVDDQWQFALMHFLPTLGAIRKPHVLIRVEEEAVKRWLFANLYGGLLFPLCHGYIAPP